MLSSAPLRVPHDAVPNVACVHNLTGVELSSTLLELLSRGLKFRPLVRHVAANILAESANKLARMIELRWFFKDHTPPSTTSAEMLFRVPSPQWMPPWSTERPRPRWLNGLREAILHTLVKACVPPTRSSRKYVNMLESEEAAVTYLKQHAIWNVIACDKNLGIALVTTEYLRAEAVRHFADTKVYTKIDIESLMPPLRKNLLELVTMCADFESGRRRTLNHPLHADVYGIFKRYICLHSDDAKIPKAKFLIKMHKPTGVVSHPYPCRLLACATQWHTTCIAKIVHWLLFPIVQKQHSFIGNSLEFIRMVTTTRFPADVIFATLDVTALYPSIDIQAALPLFREYLIRIKFPHTTFVLAAIDFIHKYSVVEWDGDVFLQSFGTAMGVNAAPAIACLYMSILEMTLFNHDSGIFMRAEDCEGVSPFVYKRYMDDAAVIFPGSRTALDKFIILLQNLAKPNIVWTFTISEVMMNFLDITLTKGEDFSTTGLLKVSLYQKPGNLFQYISPDSGHLRTVFVNLIRGEVKRILRASSSPVEYQTELASFKTRLISRQYEAAQIDNIFFRYPHSRRHDLLFHKEEPLKHTRTNCFRLVVPLSTQTIHVSRLPTLFNNIWPPNGVIVPEELPTCIRTAYTLYPPLATLLHRRLLGRLIP